MSHIHLYDLCGTPRELGIALARYAADARPGSHKMKTVNSIYAHMKPRDQLAFKGELFACKRAKRCEEEARVG